MFFKTIDLKVKSIYIFILKIITWPKMTSVTSVGSKLALFRPSRMTTVPNSEAFKDDKPPQKAPKIEFYEFLMICRTFDSSYQLVF